jgi:hypothetical protein
MERGVDDADVAGEQWPADNARALRRLRPQAAERARGTVFIDVTA